MVDDVEEAMDGVRLRVFMSTSEATESSVPERVIFTSCCCCSGRSVSVCAAATTASAWTASAFGGAGGAT